MAYTGQVSGRQHAISAGGALIAVLAVGFGLASGLDLDVVRKASEASPLDRVTRHPLTRPLASMVKRTSTSPPALARLASRGSSRSRIVPLRQTALVPQPVPLPDPPAPVPSPRPPAPEPGPGTGAAPAEVSLPALGRGAAATGGTIDGSFVLGAKTGAALACLFAAEALPLAFWLDALDGAICSCGGGGAGIAIAVIASLALRTTSRSRPLARPKPTARTAISAPPPDMARCRPETCPV